MKELIKTLEEIGLSRNQSACYLAALELGSSTIGAISKKSGIKRTSIYNFINELVVEGYIEKVQIKGRNYYAACSPNKILDLKKQKLKLFEINLDKFNSIKDKSNSAPKVKYFEGPKEVQNVIREEIYCKKEAYYIFPAKETITAIGGLEVMIKIDKERISRGVHISAIRLKKNDIKYSVSKHGKKYLRNLRFAPGSFDTEIGMGLYDTGKVGFFSSKKESYGLLIESRELYNLMYKFFKLLWNDSIPAKEFEG